MKTHFCSHSGLESGTVQVDQLTQPLTKNDTGLPCGSGKLSLRRLVHCSHVGRHARNVNRLLFARSRSIQVNKLIHHNAIIARTNQYQRGSWERAKSSDRIGPRRAIRLYKSINLDKNRFNFLTKFLRGANNFSG